jgi:hypothetical protein
MAQAFQFKRGTNVNDQQTLQTFLRFQLAKSSGATAQQIA